MEIAGPSMAIPTPLVLLSRASVLKVGIRQFSPKLPVSRRVPIRKANLLNLWLRPGSFWSNRHKDLVFGIVFSAVYPDNIRTEEQAWVK